MNFTICIKQVPDVASPSQIRDGDLVFDTGRVILNAYDASAVEEALVLTEKYGGSVDLVSAGPTKATETIRKALAMGAQKANHIVLPDDAKLDSRAQAGLLAAFFRQADFEVIACGKQSQDSDAGLTGSMLAELLGIPYATNAVGLDVDSDQQKLIVTRQGDTGQEIIELSVPCLVTCSNDMNNPRIPKIRDIMLAKRKPMETVPASDLGELQTATTVVGYEPIPERQAGPQLEGEPSEIAHQLSDLLQNEAKVI